MLRLRLTTSVVSSFQQTMTVAMRRAMTTAPAAMAKGAVVLSKRNKGVPLLETMLDSVIRIECVAVSPNYVQPWTVKPQREGSGSGFIVDGQRIVTNAHVVADAKAIFIRAHGSPQHYVAEVVAVGHECDLALLKVKDPLFWETAGEPMQFGELPELNEEVKVAGYPIGGDTVSLTSGIVSRVGLQQYSHGAIHLLAMQIDAAINPGNSGGPVLSQDGRVVGVAFQALMSSNNIGYVIPKPVIAHFLQDVDVHGGYSGFCQPGFCVQWLENEQLRRFFNLTRKQTGVVVSRLLPLYPAKSILKQRDILTAIDGIPIGNDATIPFRKRERVQFDYHILNKFPGDPINFTVLREGKSIEAAVPAVNIPALVSVHEYDRHPSYFIYAGLVFMAFAQPYLHEWGPNWYTQSPQRLVEKAINGNRQQWDEQIVIMTRVLTDEINFGYQKFSNMQVKKFNGTLVRNLNHLFELVQTNTTDTHDIFELDDDCEVIFNHQDAVAASERILSSHHIPPSFASHLPAPPSIPPGIPV